ncbi:hypothetical protein L3X38_008899 [Prunus dulcis]|uniref:Uncharacterized protein n=1 Tax=Prunus dulcis TaxID=3755 RepID=A0AAD4ZXG4_PRUDU|nr:hypothetical protein L3X38_008899 [Prunus dulcis]
MVKSLQHISSYTYTLQGVGWCVRRASLLLNAGLSFSDKTIVNIRLPRETKHMLTKNTTKDIIGDELGEAVGGDGGEDETAAALTLGSGKSRSVRILKQTVS